MVVLLRRYESSEVALVPEDVRGFTDRL